MREILERWLVFSTPLLAATTADKKQKTRQPVRRRAAPKVAQSAQLGRARKTARRAARKSPARRTKPAVRAAPSPKVQPQKPGAIAEQPQSLEPLPKPAAPIGRAILLSPENGKYADSVYPKFRWLSVGNATRYEVAWSEKPDLSDGHTVISIATEAAVPVEKPLRIGGSYYWRVRGGTEGGWGPWSPLASFTVLEEANPSS